MESSYFNCSEDGEHNGTIFVEISNVSSLQDVYFDAMEPLDIFQCCLRGVKHVPCKICHDHDNTLASSM